MYFDPYTLGFLVGAFVTLGVIFLVLLISAIVSVNRKDKRK